MKIPEIRYTCAGGSTGTVEPGYTSRLKKFEILLNEDPGIKQVGFVTNNDVTWTISWTDDEQVVVSKRDLEEYIQASLGCRRPKTGSLASDGEKLLNLAKSVE